MKFSKSAKRDYVMQDIAEDLQCMGEDVRRYRKEFPYEVDYNLAQYGNLRVYYDDIRDLFIRAGYANMGERYKQNGRKAERGEYKVSNDEVWRLYKAMVREVADRMIEADLL